MSQTDDVWAKTLLKSDKRWADQIDSDDEQTDMSAGHQGCSADSSHGEAKEDAGAEVLRQQSQPSRMQQVLPSEGPAEKLDQLKLWVKQEGSLTLPLPFLRLLLAKMKIDLDACLPMILCWDVFKKETRNGDDVLRFDLPRAGNLSAMDQVTEALMASFQRFGTWEVSASHLGKEPFAKSWKKSFLPKKLKAGLVDLVKDRSDIFAIALPNETYICCPPSELNPGEVQL
eukprot:symbB.v1.2.000675.t1/scaffold35.1/size400642/19